MSESSTRPDGLEAREQLLDAAAAEGIDVEAARVRVAELRRSRDVIRRGAFGALAALLLVGLGLWAFTGDQDPDELVADREDPTTSTSSSTSTTAPVTTSGPTTTAAPTTIPVTVPSIVTTTSPPTTAPTTTTPANQPIRAELKVLTPVLRAGEVAAIEVAWIDADHVGGEPVLVSDWGDPSVQSGQAAAATPSPCDGPGSSSGGTLRQEFRYATTGIRHVQVALTTCGGQGAFAERVTLDAQVTVTDARLGDQPATAVVVTASAAAGQPILPVLDDAAAELVPQDAPSDVVDLPGRQPALGQATATGPATVLVLPAGALGALRLTWPGSPCVSTAPVDLRSSGVAAPVLPLTSTC